MKIPKKYQERVLSIEISEGEHSEDSQRDAYELTLAEGWSYDRQGYFMCDTKKEILGIIKSAELENANV